MLGLILLAYIGHKFFDLAKLHKKNEWLFAILGVLIYFVGTFIAGIAMFIFFKVSSPETIARIDETPSYIMDLIALPFGILAAYLSYYFLKKSWEKKSLLVNEDILDIDD